MEKYAKILGEAWPFHHLKPRDLIRIVNSGHLMRYRADSVIFLESEPGAGMFVLFSGKVHLYRYSAEGQTQLIYTVKPTTMFNELTAIDDGPNPFTAIAVKDCLTWNIKTESFQNLVKCYPDPTIGFALLRVLAMRTRLLLDQCEDLSFRSVLARVAKLILKLSDDGLKTIDRQEYPIMDLAASIAVAPETISRSLSSLNDQGIISCTRKHITVLEINPLLDAAQVKHRCISTSPKQI